MPVNLIGTNEIVTFNPEEAHVLTVAPAVRHQNPLVPGTTEGLVQVVDQVHEYKMLHLSVPDDVLIPQASCKVWSPSAKMYVSGDKIECGYFEVNEEMCPDEFAAKCLRNLQARSADVTDILAGNPAISPIVGAVVVGLRDAIASSTYKVGFFGDTQFGEAGYHSAAKVNYLEHSSPTEAARRKTMMQKVEGIDTILRRRAGAGRIAFVNTNDGTSADNNATLPANILGFLQDLILASHNSLRYWHRITGVYPVINLQSGLFYAFINALEQLPGGSDNHRFIVEGTPVEGMYNYRGYPVREWYEADIFDFSIGLKNPATGHSWNQRALFTVPGNPTLITNVRATEGIGAGLAIQRSPNLKDKGLVWLYQTLGIGAGLAHNELCTYGYNTSYTYPTS